MQPHIQRLIIEYGRLVAEIKDEAIAARRAQTENEALGALSIATAQAIKLKPLFDAIVACIRLEGPDPATAERAPTKEVRCLNCGHRWRASSYDTGSCSVCGHVGCQPIGDAIHKEVPAAPGTARV